MCHPSSESVSGSVSQFSRSVMSHFLWPHGLQHTRLPVHHQLPELTQLMSFESVMPSSHLILCRPLLLLPSIFPSTWVFLNESVLCIRSPKDWSFSFSISPSNEYSALISFRIDWLDLLAVRGTLKSLLQHHNSTASILRHSAFFMVQLLHPYMTTGKTIRLTRWTFVGKVMSLLFNMLSRLVIAHLPRSKMVQRIRKDNTSKWWFCWFLVSSWSTHLSSFFTFPICFKCQTTTEWSTLSSSAASHAVEKGSASMITLSWSLSTSNGRPLCSSSSRLSSPSQNFLNHQCTVCSLAVPGQMRCWCCKLSPLLYNHFELK